MKKPSQRPLYFTNVVWKEDEHFVAQCLNIDISSFGKTHEEALTNLNEALELRFEDSNPDFTQVQSPSLTISEFKMN